MKAGITFSNFNLFHSGHVNTLDEAIIDIYYISREYRLVSNGNRKHVKDLNY